MCRPLIVEQLESRMLLAVGVQLPVPAMLGAIPCAGSSSPSSTALTPNQIRGAYGLGTYTSGTLSSGISFAGIQGDGRGQTIAIVDAYDDPNAASDLNAFSAYYGLPTFGGSGAPTFTKLNQTGGTTLPGTDPNGPSSSTQITWEKEASLDIEWAHAAAPMANIILFEADSPSSLYTAVHYAARQPGVVAISMSWTVPEFSGETSYDSSYFVTPSGHLGGAASLGGANLPGGITFLAAAGDYGAYAANTATITPQYPAASPNVLAVGGTALTVSGNNYVSETGWGNGTSSGSSGGSGGGLSAYESQPSYQSGVVSASITTTKRAYPDVAIAGDPNFGVAVYDSWDFGSTTPWSAWGGTSLACPLWAGIIAIADEGRALAGQGSLDGRSQTLPELYSLPSADFHDITSGNNGYAAGQGYDLVAGLGSPVAPLAIPGLVNYQPTVTGLNTATGPTAGGTTVIITGTDFTGATAVYFGNTVATNVVVNSATQITVTSPLATVGTVHIKVSGPGGTSTTSSADQFTYLLTPVFSGLTSPTITYGSAFVTLSGTISLVPDQEIVAVVVNGVSQSATVVGGTFSTTFDTQVLGVAGTPYSVTYSYAGDSTLAAVSDASTTLIVQQAVPTITWPNPADIVYGTLLGSTQLDATASVPGIFVYTPASGTLLTAGSNQTLSVTFTPTDTINYTTATAATLINVKTATPTIIWPNPAEITYGTALGGTQLDATASVPGRFVYTPTSGTLLTAGSNQTLSVTFTPTDTTDYTTATTTAVINVKQATPTITWPNPVDIAYGTMLGSTQLDATADVPGTFVYTPASGTVLTAGNNQTLSVTFTPTDTIDYATATATAVINVKQATPTITWPNPVDIAYGTMLGSTQLDATADVPGSFVYTPASGTVLTAGNNQSLSVTFTPTDTTDYTTVTATASINVKTAAPTITWASPADITYGTALGSTQLDATASVPGTFAYTPASGTLLTAGSNQTLSVTFTPTDTTDYTTATATAVINITRATPTITWPNPADITYGTALGSTQLDATASVPGTFAYTPASGTVLTVGNNQTLSVTFTPTDTTDYKTATATAVINVKQATPTITWPNPADIIYGTALGSTQLDATASVPGTFVYAPASGTTLGVGNNQTLSVTFTPTDTINYATVTATAVTNVKRATPTIAWPNPVDITYGTALGSTQLNATASVPGTFAYTPASGTTLTVGNNQTLSVTFTPTDTTDYTTATASALINVKKATPTVTWPNPADIVYGTALGSTQLNATASVPGTFVYTPASGTLLTAGSNQTLSVTFTPTDTTDYTTATATALLNIKKATPTITWPNPADINYGTALGSTQLDATASVPGTFVYTPTSGKILAAGSNQTLSVTFTPTDTANYTTATTTAVINVKRATPKITWLNPADITSGTALGSTQLDATASVPGTFVYTPASGKVLSVGSNQTLSVTFTPTDTTDYTTATATAVINVKQAATATASLVGVVYIDANNDGQDAVVNGKHFHVGIPSVTLTLTRTDVSGQTPLVTLSGADGSYYFGNLAAGTYKLTETQPLAYLPGIDTVGSVAGTGSGAAASGSFSGIVLGTGQGGTDYNFGHRGVRAAYVSRSLFLASTPAPLNLVEQINDPPVVALNGTAGTNYKTTLPLGGTVSIVNSAAATINKANGGALDSLIISITNPQDNANETLSADTAVLGAAPPITAHYADGVLMLSGVASTADYQRVLRTVQYHDTAVVPAATPRLISFVAADAVSRSDVATTTVTMPAAAAAADALQASPAMMSSSATTAASASQQSTDATDQVLQTQNDWLTWRLARLGR
jgi:subtilase family serine protease